MAQVLNEGSRYRVGTVPPEIAGSDAATLADALREEGVDMLLIENYIPGLPADFPIRFMIIGDGEDVITATRRLMAECPDFSAERSWARALGENFDESRTTPPPVPGAAPPHPAEPASETEQHAPAPEAAQSAPGYSGPEPLRQPQFVAQQYERPEGPMPPSYLLWAILSTILCCFIPGIVAIVFSSMVSTRYYAGDLEGARKASRQAEIWIIVSIVLGVISTTLYTPMMMMSSLG